MSIRSKHKEYLKNYLESLQYNNTNLLVYINTKNKVNTYPHIYITSGSLNPNLTSDSVIDINSYYRQYEYYINIVFSLSENEEQIIAMQDMIDDIEELIINKIQSLAVRNCTNNQNDVESWNDIYISSIIDSPVSVNIDNNKNIIKKTIRVTAKYLYSE